MANPNYTGVATDQIAGVPASQVANGSTVAVAAITVGASPFSYTAPSKGYVNITGGTVSQVALKRGTVSTNLGGVVGNFPCSAGDVIVITYSAAPTAAFVPN